MKNHIVFAGVLFLSSVALSEKLTLSPDEVKVSCVDPLNNSRYKISVKIGKLTLTRDDFLLDSHGAVNRTCDRARVLEQQLFIANYRQKKVEFDTQDLSVNPEGEVATHVITVDPGEVEVTCEAAKQTYKYPVYESPKTIDTAYHNTTVKISSRGKTYSDAFRDNHLNAHGAVISSCAVYEQIQAKLMRAAQDRRKVDYDFFNKSAEISKAVESKTPSGAKAPAGAKTKN